VNEQALKVEDLEHTSVDWLKAVDSITLTFTFYILHLIHCDNSLSNITDANAKYLFISGEPVFTLLNDKGQPVPFKLTDNQDRTYRADFEITVVGAHMANVFFVGRPVPKSPFKINVSAAQSNSDANKVKVYGPAIEQPVLTNQPTYLIIDCKEAGQGKTSLARNRIIVLDV